MLSQQMNCLHGLACILRIIVGSCWLLLPWVCIPAHPAVPTETVQESCDERAAATFLIIRFQATFQESPQDLRSLTASQIGEVIISALVNQLVPDRLQI